MQFNNQQNLKVLKTRNVSLQYGYNVIRLSFFNRIIQIIILRRETKNKISRLFFNQQRYVASRRTNLRKTSIGSPIVPILVIDVRVESRHVFETVHIRLRLDRDRFRLDFARRAFNFACEHSFAATLPLPIMLRFVVMQRDPTFRAAYRSANGFTHVRAVHRAARAHLRANEAAFRCGVDYRSYFKPDTLLALLRNRVLDVNENDCSLFDCRVRFSLMSRIYLKYFYHY